ncbi:MAG: SirB2 family protein [Proteobacteria bacterium]|uniref:SirB2 family protein n=1 Tax=Rudaea sp. TaxID=2136325 RepID=UPI00322069CA|nr:SirB2 family protein [Pseudomonadota bacterium]
MMEFYLPVKSVHICAVALSGMLFLLRGGTALAGARWPYAAPVRYASYAIDTVLLSAALMLVTMLPAALFANHWLTAKLVLVVVYIAFGVFALRRHGARRGRAACYLAALASYATIIGIAITHSPLGPLTYMLP